MCIAQNCGFIFLAISGFHICSDGIVVPGAFFVQNDYGTHRLEHQVCGPIRTVRRGEPPLFWPGLN